MKTVTSEEFQRDPKAVIDEAIKDGGVGILDEDGEVSAVISFPGPDPEEIELARLRRIASYTESLLSEEGAWEVLSAFAIAGALKDELAAWRKPT